MASPTRTSNRLSDRLDGWKAIAAISIEMSGRSNVGSEKHVYLSAGVLSELESTKTSPLSPFPHARPPLLNGARSLTGRSPDTEEC